MERLRNFGVELFAVGSQELKNGCIHLGIPTRLRWKHWFALSTTPRQGQRQTGCERLEAQNPATPGRTSDHSTASPALIKMASAAIELSRSRHIC
jgi:hypothetical protein